MTNTQQKEKPNFLYYTDWAEQLLSFPADLRLKIDDAVKRYVLYGEEPTDRDVLYSMFGLMRAQIDRDRAKYADVCNKNSENANKRWKNERMRSHTNGCNRMRSNAVDGHDALVGNGCIIGNSTKMAGEIVIDDNAIVSANVLMHQFCHVGSHVMIQGGCRFSKDIPPYIIAGREPIAFSGINIIGLRRRGFANEVIESIHNAYRIIYQSGLNTTEALKKIEDEFEKSPEIDYIINFIRNSERGIIK